VLDLEWCKSWGMAGVKAAQWPEPIAGITDVPLHQKASAINCFYRASFANKPNGTAEVRGLAAKCVCVWDPSSLVVFIHAAPFVNS
jgi:hypothetical protein